MIKKKQANIGESDAQQGSLTLQVVVQQERGRWFAQGLQIDYFAEGLTMDDALQNFIKGFSRTLLWHLQVHRSLEHFAKPAPDRFFQQLVTKASEPIRTDAPEVDLSANKGRFEFRHVATTQMAA